MNAAPTFEVEQQLQAELDAGERIAWQGQPKARLWSAKGLLPLLVALVWLGIVSTSFLTRGGPNHHSPPLFFFIPFGLIGLVVAGQPLLQYFNSGRTHYLITNRRVLIITLGSSKKVLSYYPDRLQSLERRERADGYGDIVIERSAASGYRSSQALQEIGFMNIPDVKNIEGMIRNLATKSSPRQV